MRSARRNQHPIPSGVSEGQAQPIPRRRSRREDEEDESRRQHVSRIKMLKDEADLEEERDSPEQS